MAQTTQQPQVAPKVIQITEAQWIAADLEANVRKVEKAHRHNDALAMHLQINTQDKVGAV